MELNLAGPWKVRAENGKHTLSAQVPGDIHYDLLRAGRIPDPYLADNELQVQWVGEQDWVYGREFRVDETLLAHQRVLLRCEGLDTLATILVNGNEVATTDNMFRTWEFDIKPMLRVGDNRVEIRFASAAGYVTKRVAARPLERPLPKWNQPKALPGGNFIRKQQCNFGWDWGPCLITCGIWRPIRIVAFDTARITDVQVRQDHVQAGWVGLDVVVSTAKVARVQGVQARVKVSVGDQELATAEVAMRGKAATARLELKKPRLWWPNGLGEAALHTVEVDVIDRDGNLLDTWMRRIGLRTLRLDRHKDEWGESFQFVVNGVPFFAKGANWIPVDAILARRMPEDYQRLVADAAAVHMNMLRVWGGGIYEDDAFYDACDEQGICIWQDFMFACATYETYDASFMRSVKAEFEDNVCRLRHHACIALWCGNNELEMGLVGEHWYHYPEHKNWGMSWKDYGKLFDRLLPETLRRLDPDRDYWPGSPHTPPPYNRSDSNAPQAGDAHLWKVWFDKEPFEWYRTCGHRFNSEFGFQSFPEPKTLYEVIPAGARNITSALMEHHQRSQPGNATIMQYMFDWFLMPKDFETTLWLSQILQGNAIKYAVEHWRRSMPRGMGTLYWQMNDCWPVASWSSIDFPGRWKALHYLARHFFAPVLVSGLEDPAAGTVEIHTSSDRRESQKGTVRWRVSDAAGREFLAGERAVRIAPGTNRLVTTLKLKKALAAHGAEDLLVWLELALGDEIVSRNLVTFARPKRLKLEDPGIRNRVFDNKDGTFRVRLTAKRPALWCWLELDGADARWSDNFVHLEAGRPVDVTAIPAKKMSVAQLRNGLLVRSLLDTSGGSQEVNSVIRRPLFRRFGMLTLATMSSCVVLSAGQAHAAGFATVAPFHKAPFIDGVASADEWAGALGYTQASAWNNGRLATRRAMGSIGWDKEKLYLLMEAQVPAGYSFTMQSFNEGDGYGLQIPMMEFWIDPHTAARKAGTTTAKDNYFQFLVGPNGYGIDIRVDGRGTPDVRWKSDWATAGKIDPQTNLLTIEVAIPWKDLGVSGNPDSRELGVLLAYTFCSPFQQLACSPIESIPGRGFNAPQTYPTIKFRYPDLEEV